MKDYLSTSDGGALVERLPCPGCGASVTKFRDVLWDDNDTPHECETAYRGPVAGLVDAWQLARAELRAIEEAEHPAFADQWGRVWTWVSGDLWHHDDTLALTRDMVSRLTSLPPERLRANPNYHKLCEACRSRWSDASPVSPRVLLKGQGWFDVRDRQYYAAQEGPELWA